jgi:uncharacterized membrane protein (UPF0127 family)
MFRNQRHVFVYNKTQETFLAFRVEVCDSIWGRLRGLLGKRSLQPDGGAWIVPANAVHTIGMLFSFDLVLIDKNFKVVGLRELVRPFTITLPERKAESVLELPAHSIFRSRTKIGDQLLIERYEAKKPSKSNGDGQIIRPPSDHPEGIPLEVGPGGHVPPVPQSSGQDSRRSRLAVKTR